MATIALLLSGERKPYRKIEHITSFNQDELELYTEYLFKIIERALGVTRKHIRSKSRKEVKCSARRIFPALFLEQFPTIPDGYIGGIIKHDRTSVCAMCKKHSEEIQGINKYAICFKKVVCEKEKWSYTMFKESRGLMLSQKTFYSFEELQVFFRTIGINFNQWVAL